MSQKKEVIKFCNEFSKLTGSILNVIQKIFRKIFKQKKENDVYESIRMLEKAFQKIREEHKNIKEIFQDLSEGLDALKKDISIKKGILESKDNRGEFRKKNMGETILPLICVCVLVTIGIMAIYLYFNRNKKENCISVEQKSSPYKNQMKKKATFTSDDRAVLELITDLDKLSKDIAEQ